jgi:hypothetical protein
MALMVWLVDMANAVHENTRIFINVGFNKGYNFANWMNAFIPENITAKSWHGALVNSLPQNMSKYADCGACADCKFEISRDLLKFSDTQLRFSAIRDIVLIGLDLNCKNIEIVNGIIDQVGSSTDMRMSGVTTYLTCVAVSDHIGEVQLRATECDPGYEICSIHLGEEKYATVMDNNTTSNITTSNTTSNTTTSNTKTSNNATIPATVSVPISTLDNYISNFTHSHKHSHDHVRRLAHLLADNTSIQIRVRPRSIFY